MGEVTLNTAQKMRFMEVIKKISQRLNFEGDTYYRIFVEAHTNYLANALTLAKLETSEQNTEETESQIELLAEQELTRQAMRRHRLVAITFATMFLESVIWDYAAVNTSQNLAKEHLNKLDLVSKWKVIPKLINGKKVSIGSKSIELLKKLNTERNAIVHSKSKPIPTTYDDYMKYFNKTLNITIDRTIECVKECIKELQKVDTTNYWFLTTEIVKKDIPEL